MNSRSRPHGAGSDQALDVFFLGKTGTLTHGDFSLQTIEPPKHFQRHFLFDGKYHNVVISSEKRVEQRLNEP